MCYRPPGRRRNDDNLLHRRQYGSRYDPYDSYYSDRMSDRYLPPYSRYGDYDPYPRRMYPPAPPASSYMDDPYARPPPEFYERRRGGGSAGSYRLMPFFIP